MDARALLARKKLERKKAAAAKTKINSPFAEYDSLGKLKCKICLINIKHESLWNSHVSGKQHKLAIQRIREEKNKLKSSISSSNSHVISNRTIPKKETPPKQNTLLLGGYDSDSDADSDDNNKNSNEVIEDEPNRKRIKMSENTNNLPPGFFDNNNSNSDSENDNDNNNDDKSDIMKKDEKDEENDEGETQNLSSLPKGFFDNHEDNDNMEITEDNEENNETPLTDLPSNFFDQSLKPKQMLDKEKVAEDEKLKNEMELFEKEIQQESLNVDIVEEQEEDDFYERRDQELEIEQKQYMSKMAQLKNKKQQIQENKIKNHMSIKKKDSKKEKVEKMDEDSDSDSDSDSDLENELYNWRSRGL
ncbi:hypothetical protein BCR36DRAFT_408438 [Piromyces finnis]|uniref:C2H2-type domain-containing protein n=1 Tax=Piromyces finnis TaxID=1754191 RepID=A0A1Y1VMS6_9FUNG|nr:hypothetical protein BCR36DRAFT_408438 [Piromyces finnis]|eukprot:ORX60079.1 hypothetical protein BCR36DRAFT_408438 [Piromyces finnis]